MQRFPDYFFGIPPVAGVLKKEYPVNQWLGPYPTDFFLVSAYLYEQGIGLLFMGDYSAFYAGYDGKEDTNLDVACRGFYNYAKHGDTHYIEIAFNGSATKETWQSLGRCMPGERCGQRSEEHALLMDYVQREHKIPQELLGKPLFFEQMTVNPKTPLAALRELSVTFTPLRTQSFWLNQRFTVPVGIINRNLPVAIPELGMEVEVVLDELKLYDVTADIHETWNIDELNIGKDEQIFVLRLHYHSAKKNMSFTFHLADHLNQKYVRSSTADAPWAEFLYGGAETTDPNIVTATANLWRVDPSALKPSYELSLLEVTVFDLPNKTDKGIWVKYDD